METMIPEQKVAGIVAVGTTAVRFTIPLLVLTWFASVDPAEQGEVPV